MKWLCIDPGISGTGWCLLENKKLLRWGNIYSNEDTWLGKADDICQKIMTEFKLESLEGRYSSVYCEWPYGVFKAEKNTSILKLAFLIGKLDSLFGKMYLIPVQQHIGQLTKDANSYRIHRFFGLKQGTIVKHACDAVSIAKYVLEKGVIK